MTRWQGVFDRLDRLSRTRALTDSESMLLERAILEIDGVRAPEPVASGKHWTAREEQSLRAMIRDGVAVREAGRRLGKGASAAVGKWQRMQRAGA